MVRCFTHSSKVYPSTWETLVVRRTQNPWLMETGLDAIFQNISSSYHLQFVVVVVVVVVTKRYLAS